jgi:simple sugar transport system substrate-binding protein
MTSTSLKKSLRLYLSLTVLIFFVIWGFIHLPMLRPDGTSPYHGQRFIIFAGSSPDFPFSQIIARGATQAAEDLGVDIELVWSRWNQQQMIIDLKEAIDRNPDGIAIMGHPGELAISPLVREAQRKGILITSLNVDLPELERKFSSEGFGYIGQDIYGSGLSLAEAVIRVAQPLQGETILVLGSLSFPTRGLRSQGILDGFMAQELNVIYQEGPVLRTSIESEKEQTRIIQDLLNDYPQARILVDDVNLIASANALEQIGIPPEQLFLAGFDMSSEIVSFLETGRINLISDQQPFLQGYLSVVQLVLTRTWGFSGLRIDTRTGIVTPDILDRLKPFILQGIR